MEEIQIPQDYEKELADLQRNIQSSAKWFYWIAGLSIINTLIIFFGGGVSFIVGLGITQLVDGIVYEASYSAKLVALFINILISGLFVFFGYFAHKQEKWAFLTGMVLYFMDGLLFLLVEDWLSVGFHVFVLFSLYAGIKSLGKIEKLQYEKTGGISSLEQEMFKI
jgi:hypothetical protein